MHPKKLTDKTVRPLTTLTNLTPAMVTGGLAVNTIGRLPLGYYKGGLAFWDLDLANNQPNVLAEEKHILGLLDGREAAYDSLTLTITAAETAGLAHTGTLTVPTGELWFINNIQTTVPANATANWYCSLWTDRLGALGHGQPFYAAAQAVGVHLAEFSPPAPLWQLTNKQVALRAPAGTVFTFVLTNVTSPATVTGILQIYGWLGKPLVL